MATPILRRNGDLSDLYIGESNGFFQNFTKKKQCPLKIRKRIPVSKKDGDGEKNKWQEKNVINQPLLYCKKKTFRPVPGCSGVAEACCTTAWSPSELLKPHAGGEELQVVSEVTCSFLMFFRKKKKKRTSLCFKVLEKKNTIRFSTVSCSFGSKRVVMPTQSCIWTFGARGSLRSSAGWAPTTYPLIRSFYRGP